MENTSSPAQEEPSAAMDHSAAHSVATANAQDPPLSPSTRPYPEPSNEDDSPRKKRAVQDDSSQSHRQQVATDRHSQDSQTIQSNIDESDQDSAHDSNEEEENGISDYEKLREARIKRNQQYLAQLGLDGMASRGGTNKPTSRKRPRPKVDPIPKRTSLGRASKQRPVDYVGDKLDLRSLVLKADRGDTKSVNEENSESAPPPRKRSSNASTSNKNPVPKEVYLEFNRINRQRKENVKQMKRNIKLATKHVYHWQKEVDKYKREMQLEHERQKRRLREKEEREHLGGKTKAELLQELDQRQHELWAAVCEYENAKKEQQIKEQQRLLEAKERKKQAELERTFEMIDALDRFPKAFNSISHQLNSMLLSRSPKDPPPPRRSSRGAVSNEHTNNISIEKSKKARRKDNSKTPNDQQVAFSTPEQSPAWSNFATLQQPPATQNGDASIDGATTVPIGTENSKQKKEPSARQVGGWISPTFSAELERSWLCREKSLKSFDLSLYAPQVGDVVLYYPGAHKEFLEVHPDYWGKKIRGLRTPLWVRAQKLANRNNSTKQTGQQKLAAARLAGTANGHETAATDPSADGSGKSGNPVPWWTDEWIAGIDSLHGQYPIVCRVERTHAEFPYDPNAEHKVINSDGCLSWVIPSEQPKKSSEKLKRAVSPIMRLCVLLKPLTPVVPPKWEPLDERKGSEVELRLPPTFSVVTFPTSDVDPFVIPFAWAYCVTHSLSIGDAVVLRQDNQVKGKINSFISIGEDYGSFRLDDKLPVIQSILANLAKEGPKALEAALKAESHGHTNGTVLPLADASFIVEFFTQYCRQVQTTTCETTDRGNGMTSHPLLEIIRSTLPLHRGIGIRRDVFHRDTLYESRWNLRARSKKLLLEDTPIFHLLKMGIPHRLETNLRIKIEFALHDILKNRPESAAFVELITEDIAPSYYCAVPIGMHFGRILARLNEGKDRACYYTSVESILGDIQAILDNCVLYNNPNTPLVETCARLIPDIKKRVVDVQMQHLRDMNSALKSRVATASPSRTSLSRKIKLIPDTINTPYRGAINYTWLQTVKPDCTHALPTPIMAKTLEYSSWIPQAGDMVLYSRALHGQFIHDQAELLSHEQRLLPEFEPKCASSVPSLGSSEEVGADMKQLDESLERQWLVATIRSVRVSFPVNAKVENRETLLPALPVLILGLHFACELLATEDVTVCWRPLSDKYTGSSDSFLRPLWQNLKELPWHVDENSIFASSEVETTIQSSENFGLKPEIAGSIGRCFDILKQRCLAGITPDFVDPRFCLENARQGILPKTATPLGHSLPTFEDVLLFGEESGKRKLTGSRKPGRKVKDEALTELARLHYLPPWATDKIESNARPLPVAKYESLMPFPNLCLELVRMRLKEGYYRHVVAIENDLREAYVTSILFLLSGPTSRTKNRLSMRKIAKHLHSRGNDKKSGLIQPKQLKKKARKESAIVSDMSPALEVSTKIDTIEAHLEDFTEEEKGFIVQIDRIRRLYVMAILSVLETRHMECLMGTSAHKMAVEKMGFPSEPEQKEDNEKQRAETVQRIRYLLSAVGRDPCQNRFSSFGLVKFKFSVGGEQITTIRNAQLLPNDVIAPQREISFVQFVSSDFYKADALAKFMFGRTGKRATCARCQTQGSDYFTCRVGRCHSNPDFDFYTNLIEYGGVDGLLKPFQVPASIRTISGKNDAVNAGDRQSTEMPNSQDIHTTANTPTDPTPALLKAQSAVDSASYLYRKALTLSSKPVRLGEKFIKAVFPIDPADGHYLWCTICGRSGDVLCCDGCANVVHTSCIGLGDIPEGDWYCSKCSLSHVRMENLDTLRRTDLTPTKQQGNNIGSIHHIAQTMNTISKEEEMNGNGSTKQRERETLESTPRTESQFSSASTVPSKATTETSSMLDNNTPAGNVAKFCEITDDEYEEKAEELAALLAELQSLDGAPKVEAAKLTSNQTIPIGTLFFKTFPNQGEFCARVIAVPSASKPYYHVQYEDKDEEDLEHAELFELVEKSKHRIAKMTEDEEGRQRLSIAFSTQDEGNSVRGEQQARSSPAMTSPPEGTKRKRGRPRKSDTPVEETVSPTAAVPSSTEGAKKRRGRPRKSNMPAESTTLQKTIVPPPTEGTKRKSHRSNKMDSPVRSTRVLPARKKRNYSSMR